MSGSGSPSEPDAGPWTQDPRAPAHVNRSDQHLPDRSQKRGRGAASHPRERKRSYATSLLAAERRMIEMIAGGASLSSTLDALCSSIDAQVPGLASAVLLTDADGKRLWPAAGPNVPNEWKQELSPVLIGPRALPSGVAAFRGQRVLVTDIAADPLYASDRRSVALRAGLRAAFIQPLLSKDREVLGTFAMYFGTAREPTDADLRLMDGAGHVAVIAIEGERAQSALRGAFEKLKTSEAQLRRIVDAIPTQVWRLRGDGTVDYLNQRWHDYTGISQEDAYVDRARGAAGTFLDATDVVQRIVHPDDAPAATAKWSRILPAGTAGEFEVRLRRHDGQYRWFIVHAEPIHDENGEVVQWYGTNTDIEDLKRAESKLRDEEHELRGIVDAIPQSIAVLGTDGSPLYANRSFLDYTGLALQEALSPGSRSRVFHPEDVERLKHERQRALSGDAPFENEQRLRGADGQYRWFLIRYNPVCGLDGRVLRWYATGTDIHERKQAEDRVLNENLALREEIDRRSMFEEIVGSSEGLRRVLAQVSKVAGTDSTALVLGETGTGKELLARAIHRRSQRANGPFIRINCAAIPPSLVTSELFGHEKGAFTGALQRRVGRFEAANGGTIFLDEVGDLPAETQIALFRVLQEREFERVGSSQPTHVDVRIVAATDRDLEAAVTAGSFRQELFYRLNVFPIQIPPLRERKDDIPLLVHYLIDRYSKRAGKRIRSISKKTLELFTAYEWPGNVRELQNVVERAIVLCDGDTFVVDESWLRRKAPTVSGPTVSLTETLADRERAIIETALAASKGRVSGASGAAAKLGLPRQTLESKIRALRINKHRYKPV